MILKMFEKNNNKIIIKGNNKSADIVYVYLFW